MDIIDGHSLFKTNDEIDTVVIKQERHKISTLTLFAFCSRKYLGLLNNHLMARVSEKNILILIGNLNLGLNYSITTV